MCRMNVNWALHSLLISFSTTSTVNATREASNAVPLVAALDARMWDPLVDPETLLEVQPEQRFAPRRFDGKSRNPFRRRRISPF